MPNAKTAARTFFLEEFADDAVRAVLEDVMRELPFEDFDAFKSAAARGTVTLAEKVRLGRSITDRSALASRVCARLIKPEPDALRRWNDLDLFRFRRLFMENKAIREALDEEVGAAGIAMHRAWDEAVHGLHDR